ncbi:spore coat protein GerQ [Alkalihalobacillus oceani]|uniref:Spore coat protein GerQ n=1 Tax=Halalkalibacter oceani TaxID=1653776 RepID=A0A9X2INW4_9BACI|nr:spore coat protein GerQ [Halalkalibacter oceani]MCM3714201.1 spore coat protein GerQ [Halalkalibacter oceani]
MSQQPNQQWNQATQGFENYGYAQQQQGYAQPMQPQPQTQAQGQMPYFSAQNYQVPGFVQQQQAAQNQGGLLPLEQSFIENILRLNRGKMATFYMTYENNDQWNAKIFRGRIEEAGRDHIIVGDPETGMHYLLLMVTLDYVTFEDPIDYEYPYGGQTPLTQYSPRP